MKKTNDMIRDDYCAGNLSIQKVADKHGIPKSTLIDMAKKNGWQREKKWTKKSDQNENGRTDGDIREGAKILVDDEQLTPQQRLFIAEYLKDNNATQAANRAGYSKKTAREQGARLLSNVHIARTIAEQQKLSIVRALAGADEVLEKMWSIATFDANQLSQYRRGSCRYCWGEDHNYQWRDDVEYQEKLQEAIAREKPEPNDTGGYGYSHNREPHPECPRCDGDGIGQAYFADTRSLSAGAAMAYAGVKVSKNGIEITAINRERMFEAIIKRLGLADSELAQRLQLLEIDRRSREIERIELENDRLRKSISGVAADGRESVDLDEEFKRLRNDKVRAEINRLNSGPDGETIIVVHKALQVPGAMQPEKDGNQQYPG